MKKPEKISKEKKDVPKKGMTIKFTPPETELDVCQLLYQIIEQNNVKRVLTQLAVNTYLEGVARCNLLTATFAGKEDVDKVIENAQAAYALKYLLHNWDKCVEEGKKEMEKASKKT